MAECSCLVPWLDGDGQHAPDCAIFRVPPPACHTHPDRPATVEIGGRVLVCTECAGDPALIEHAEHDWR